MLPRRRNLYRVAALAVPIEEVVDQPPVLPVTMTEHRGGSASGAAKVRRVVWPVLITVRTLAAGSAHCG